MKKQSAASKKMMRMCMHCHPMYMAVSSPDLRSSPLQRF